MYDVAHSFYSLVANKISSQIVARGYCSREPISRYTRRVIRLRMNVEYNQFDANLNQWEFVLPPSGVSRVSINRCSFDRSINHFGARNRDNEEGGPVKSNLGKFVNTFSLINQIYSIRWRKGKRWTRRVITPSNYKAHHQTLWRSLTNRRTKTSRKPHERTKFFDRFFLFFRKERKERKERERKRERLR